MAQKRTNPKRGGKREAGRKTRDKRRKNPGTRNKKLGTGNFEPGTPFQWWHLALIAAITFIAYIPALDNGFVNWDDPVCIINNDVVHGFSGENMVKSFTEEVSYNYHPLTNISQTIDWVLGGGDAGIFHITSLLIHIVNALLVFLFCMMLTGKQWVGLGSALLFAIHPAHVESVAWATERKDVLYGLFFILTLIQYLRYVRGGGNKHYMLAIVFAICSFLSKPAAIPLPLVLILIDYFEGRKLMDRKLIVEKLPFFAMAIIIGLITFSFQSDSAVRTLTELGFGERIIFASYSYVMYMVKFFFPYPLYAFYPYPNLADLPTWYYGMPVLALAITGAVLWFGRKNKFLWFGLLFFLLVISISLQLVSFGGAVMADRYTYIPYIGLGIAVLMGIDKLLEKRKNLQKPLLIGGIAVGAIFAALTWVQADSWRDGEALWTHLINRAPQPVRIAYTNRGDYYKDNQQFDKALSDFNKALEISPNEPGTVRLRAKTLFDLQRYDESLTDYKQLVISTPDDKEAWSNIAVIQVLTKQYDDALKSLDRTLQLDPNHAPTYKTQGYLYNDLGRHQASIQAYEKYMQLQGADATIYHSIALSYAQLGNGAKALEAINEAIRLRPNVEQYLQLKQQLTNP